MVKKAILFCENNDGILELAQFLYKSGWEIYSNGETAEILKENNISYLIEHALDSKPRNIGESTALIQKILRTKISVSDQPFENPDDENNVFLVCVNFDPLTSGFETIPKLGRGSPALTSYTSTMIRNCCTNFQNVLILTDPIDYNETLIELRTDDVQQSFRMYLAGKALNIVSAFDSANAFAILQNNPFAINQNINYLSMPYKKKMELHHGANSNQKAVIYQYGSDGGSLSGFKKIQGRELTHKIVADTSFAWDQVCSLYDNLKTLSAVKSENCDGYAYTTQFTPLTGTVYTVMVKYRLVVGAGLDTNVVNSFQKTLSYDLDCTIHATLACSAVIDGTAAREMVKYEFSAIVAPGFTEEAKSILAENRGIRLITANRPSSSNISVLILDGGCVLQNKYKQLFDKWIVPTKARPDQKLCDEMAFGMCIAKHAYSYANVCIKDNAVVGISSCQSSRFKSLGSVAFEAKQTFKLHPTEDGVIADVLVCDSSIELCEPVKELIDLGVKAIIQTGGLPNDQEFIDYCDAHNVAMIFTGVTHTNY